MGRCWTTPIVVHVAGRDQLITTADPWAIAYNPADGKESSVAGEAGPRGRGPLARVGPATW